MKTFMDFFLCVAGSCIGFVIGDRIMFYLRTGALFSDSYLRSEIRLALRRFKRRIVERKWQ